MSELRRRAENSSSVNDIRDASKSQQEQLPLERQQQLKESFPLSFNKPNARSERREKTEQRIEEFKEDWISFDMLLLFGVGILVVVVFIFAVLKGDVGVHSSLESWLPRGGRGQVPDISFRIHVPLEAVYLGQSVSVSPPENKQIICDACQGSGAKEGAAGVKTCPECKGSGSQHVRVQLAPGFVQQFQQECGKCQGRGRVVKHRCPKCQGQRVLSETKDLTIDIPQGCTEGQVLRLSRQGHQIPDVGVGDMVVEIFSSSHALFRREGSNLHTTLTVSLKEALLGFDKMITHLDGRGIAVSRKDSVTPHKTVIEIKHEGIPRGHGSLFVTIEVQFPNSLTTTQVNDIRALLS